MPLMVIFAGALSLFLLMLLTWNPATGTALPRQADAQGIPPLSPHSPFPVSPENWWTVAVSNIFLGMQQALVWSATIFIMVDYLGQVPASMPLILLSVPMSVLARKGQSSD